MQDFGAESSLRKCVYSYEDKYNFSRILPSDSLVFDSHFESGNLNSAYRVIGEDTQKFRGAIYELYMHNDLEKPGQMQWFYFSVANARVGQEVKFVIRNFMKADSLYNEGMRPSLT